MKKWIRVLLPAILLTALLSTTASADTGVGLEPGDPMPVFTFSLTDGSTVTLSELYKEKDLVVLNLFASWCGPCEAEFPEMEAVYQMNKDRMEIIAVSAYPDDTMEIISAYKADHGLSFPMGLAGDIRSILTIPGYPTTLLIDRSGKIGLVKVGAFLSREDFEESVNYFLSPDYDGTPLGAQKAFNFTAYLLRGLLLSTLLLIIGRWGILRKAGKKGWHSLIPLLNVYKEYATVWNGWIGVLADLCIPIGMVCNLLQLPTFIYHVLIVLSLAIGIPEGLKLAKAFGKGKVFGVLMALPVFKPILRLVLGLGRAEFRPEPESSAA